MSNKVALSKNGRAIRFQVSHAAPNTAKKLRQTEDIKNLYSFIHEHDLRREVYKLLTTFLIERRRTRI